MCMSMFSNKAARLAAIQQQQAAEAAQAQQAQIAEQQRQTMLADEATRRNQITQGNANIDSAFAGFNDAWYDQAASRYSGALLPDLEQQQTSAAAQLKAALAGRGILESSAGAAQMAELEKRGAGERARIANEGRSFANTLRQRAQESRNQLYAQAATAADPSQIAAAATGQATTLANTQMTPANTQSGDVFGAFLSPFLASASAAQNSASGSAPRSRINLAPTGQNNLKVYS